MKSAQDLAAKRWAKPDARSPEKRGGRPAVDPKCPCGQMTIRRAASRNHKCYTVTYSVIVRNPNSWSASTGIHEELANCGHKHKSFFTAQACYDRLTVWRNGSTSARWYNAQIEPRLSPG